MDRQAAMELLREHTRGETLVRHCLAVEAAMRAYARKFQGDEEQWGTAGLLHDLDWDLTSSTPERHATHGAQILKDRGWPEVIVRAVLSHADHTGVARESPMEKCLFAVDELTGFITAVALVKPSRSLAEVDARSVRKKMKDKAFARNVSRDDIVRGAQELGVDLDEHIEFVAKSLGPIAGQLGLSSSTTV